MHAIVVGCGRVGSGLAASLHEAGHTVAVIDKAPNAFRRLPEGFDGLRIVGFGFDRDTLQEAGIDQAKALAAVTSGDNSNILSARIARETFSIPHVVARIYDPRRAVIYQRLGIPTVATVTWTTDQVMRRLFPEQSVTDWSDPTGSVRIVERLLPDVWAGERLAGLDSGERYRLVSVTRGGAGRLASHELVGQEGDVLHLAVRADSVGDLEALLDSGPMEAH